MHLLRGSGLAGLRGMLPATPLSRLHLPLIPSERRPQNPALQLVRPWLQTSRLQILAYCRQNDLHPRQDATNTDTTFFRNRLRYEVIPQLRQINPRLTRVIGRTALALQGDYEALAQHRATLWQKLAQSGPDHIRFPLTAFRALPVGDQRALLRRAIAHLRPDLRNINWEHSERLLTILQTEPERRSGGPYTLVAGLQAWLDVDYLDIAEIGASIISAPQIAAPRTLSLPGTLSLESGWQIEARQVQWAATEPPPWQNAADASCIWLPLDIPAPLQVRPRQSGDRITVFGLGGSKAISDLMTELKLPRPARSHWPLLLDAKGRILWLIGGRASEYCRVPASATTAWQICLIKM
jgi:tRNA(Ile)-lysidine synthase